MVVLAPLAAAVDDQAADAAKEADEQQVEDILHQFQIPCSAKSEIVEAIKKGFDLGLGDGSDEHGGNQAETADES